MFVPADPGIWQGRVDVDDGMAGRRWHQLVRFSQASANGMAMLGLASDLGVRLNQGRPGAAAGPAALRGALANLSWHHSGQLYDDGDIRVDEDLQAGQGEYANRVEALLSSGSFVLGLGGGHEIGWASYLGCRNWLDTQGGGKVLGVLNFDAHFDLRKPAPDNSSGTPF